MIGIYKITSPSRRVYIGQSININKRFKDYHNLTNCKTQSKLYRSFKKYGVKDHIFEIKEYCNIDQLNIKERYWQDYYNVIESGLNCLLTPTNEKKLIFSKETLIKKSESMKGDKHPNYGKTLSDDTKSKISIGNRGKVIPDHIKLKISQTLKGVKKKHNPAKGLDNGNSRSVTSENVITGEKIIDSLNNTALYFNVNRELIHLRINKGVVKCRKLKDWIFYDSIKQ